MGKGNKACVRFSLYRTVLTGVYYLEEAHAPVMYGSKIKSVRVIWVICHVMNFNIKCLSLTVTGNKSVVLSFGHRGYSRQGGKKLIATRGF